MERLQINAATLPDGQVMQEVDANRHEYFGVIEVDKNQERRGEGHSE